VSVLGGLFLVAHGLVHLAIWLPAPKEDAPFDPGHSWLLGDVRRRARALAVAAGTLLALAGILMLAGAGAGGGLAVLGAAVSVALIGLTFHPWLLGAVAIDVVIAVVALT
jgi:hypothetical protein